MVDLDQIAKFTESPCHTSVIQSIVAPGWKKDITGDTWDRQRVFEVQCHLAVLLTLHTGKRPGVLCGMRLHEVLKAQGMQDAEGHVNAWKIRVVPECPYARFKTVGISHLLISPAMFKLLRALTYLRQQVDRAKSNDRLFTSVTGIPLKNVRELFQKAWHDAGMKGRFTSTMIRHTIVTHAYQLGQCTAEEIQALAQGMDHSV